VQALGIPIAIMFLTGTKLNWKSVYRTSLKLKSNGFVIVENIF
jgi:hypothetical protein